MNWTVFAGSLVAVLFVAWLVGRLGLGAAAPLDETTARRIAQDTFIGHRFGAVALDASGRAALVEGADGSVMLVRAHGDKWVARHLRAPLEAKADGDLLIVEAGETMFGATTLELGAGEAARWAPRLQGALGA